MSEEIISKKQLEVIQKESEEQELPESKAVISVSPKIRKRLNNLPDPTNAPLGYDEHKKFDRVFPYLHIPTLHPRTNNDTVIFNSPESEPNKLYLGDNLEVLRTLKSDSIDLIYIDPPFFSGRNYNVIWGDTNEVRTFEDIWEGGITSYLIWLNARLWEMKRVLKKTGSIYVHCDWHASHYIKTEMDKIFGYDHMINEIIWSYRRWTAGDTRFQRMHDIILFYSKNTDFKFKIPYEPYGDWIKKDYQYTDATGKRWRWHTVKGNRYKVYLDDENKGVKVNDVWNINYIVSTANERIGYPTQKPEPLLERIIKASSNEGDVVADFFVGGGTTCAVASKLKRKFIGCDSSRVAISVTLDRLVKIGEEMSGVKSNISSIPRTKLFGKESFQPKFQAAGAVDKVPNIEVNYLGVYPTEKFKELSQDEFNKFVLTSYGASINTAESVISGFRPPAHQEPILVGPPDSKESISSGLIKKFYEEIKSTLEPNKLIKAKIIGWRFSRQVLNYIKVLNQYSQKYNLPLELEAIPLDSKEFRSRILQRMPDVEENELFLRFSKSPVIGEIKIKKVESLEYEFEAIDALSSNEDGWLVNCQWDFDYQEGHFAADKEYVLSREKKKDKKRAEIFEAILTSEHKFEKEGEYTIACKVQDNLAGEAILSKKIAIKE